MAGRDIQIPFGPDKTGGLGLSLPDVEIEPEGADPHSPEESGEWGREGASASSDPFAEPPAEKYARREPASKQARRNTDLPVRTAGTYRAPLPPESEPESERGSASEADSQMTAPLDDEVDAETPGRVLVNPRDDDSGSAGEAVRAHRTDAGTVPGPESDTSGIDRVRMLLNDDADSQNAGDNRGEFVDEMRDDGFDGESGEEYRAGGYTDEEATEQGIDEMQLSFLALKDSVGQGRELKARERELKEFEQQLESDKRELADREEILNNYQALVAEQDAIINASSQRRDAQKAELAQIASELEETTEALERMRDYHETEMQPLEAELGRARANADQAKNDERSRKSELNAAESELRRAGSNDDSTMASAKLQQVKRSHEEAKLRSEKAKDTLAEVQRIYDDAMQQIRQSEGPLERSIEDLKARGEALKDSVAKLGEDISKARKRRQYCDAVYQYPDETAKLRKSVESDERTISEMTAENDELRTVLAQSKQQAKKAKLALGIVAVIIVVFLITLFIVMTR